MRAAVGALSPAVATRRLFAGVVVSTCGSYAAVTMAPVVALQITGSKFLAGLPVAALLAGAGAGATPMAALIRRTGARSALIRAYAVGAAACALCLVAVVVRSFPLLLVGLLLVGVGQATNQLVRYVAADLQHEDGRARVIGWMISAQAAGAVLGPLSVGPLGRVAADLGGAIGSGGFGLGIIVFTLAAAMHARRGLHPGPLAVEVPGATGGPGSSVWALPNVQVALAAMVTSLFVMLLVMAVTPLHVHAAGHGAGTVGAIMGVHTFGMFALAPLVGRLAASVGPVPTIVSGLSLLALATGTAALAPPSSRALLALSLFLLGLGWCMSFVAGSVLLTVGLDGDVRASVQGRVEAVTWIGGAAAAVLAGLLLGGAGFERLSLLAGLLLAVPVGVLVVHRRAALPAAS